MEKKFSVTFINYTSKRTIIAPVTGVMRLTGLEQFSQWWQTALKEAFRTLIRELNGSQLTMINLGELKPECCTALKISKKEDFWKEDLWKDSCLTIPCEKDDKLEDILDEECLAYLGKKNLAKYVKYCLSLALPKQYKTQIDVKVVE